MNRHDHSGRWPAVQFAGLVGLAAFAAVPATLVASTGDAGGSEAPESIELVGVVRDFRERDHAHGHTDFERRPDLGFGLYGGNVSPQLGIDGKPVFTGAGWKVTRQWQDGEGRPICWHVAEQYPADGDSAGGKGGASQGGIESAESFNQWYRDVPGVNISKTVPLTLVRQSDGSYVFDDKHDPYYDDLGGFFPIEGDLFGNPGGNPDRNFHFTFELHTQFTYQADGAQLFKFIGDDDVWVFINGELVIDLSGVHSAESQTVDLNRLGLEDDETYALDFFFAERHRTQSNFRIQTNLELETATVPSVTAAFD